MSVQQSKDLTEQQEGRLETAYQMYSAEFHNDEAQTPMPEAGGVPSLLEFYNKAIAEGIADKIAERDKKDKEELMERIGTPPK